ncbi:MAG TPA: endonuclease/exonuclease/phosphatase family protein [Verrucomicrobiae bacterium]|nr:endonuclease/exonuclease/phosphatase family protein [Verrucomicrobiae bacterium]
MHTSSALTLKILTLNTHKGFTTFNRKFVLHELRDAVRATGADLVFLQEVLGVHSRHQARQKNWPSGPQYEFLADAIWRDFAYGRNAVYPHGHHGNAVLSKFPIARHDNHDISVQGPEKRGLLHCVVQVPEGGREIHGICVHLSLTEGHRRQQLELLCKLVERTVPVDAPLVVAGDFNDWRCRARQVLQRCGLVEAFVASGRREPRTFPARFPLLRLDRIYVRNVRAVRPAVHSVRPWSHLSDHAALSAEIDL